MLDGENPGAEPGAVDAHLAGCAACLAWRDAAHEVTRRARLRLAGPEPALPGAAFDAAAAQVAARSRTALLARAGLVAVAAALLALTVPSLLFGHDHTAPVHVAHEMGAFDTALAVGFLVAAWRPGRALGMRTLVGVAAVLLLVTAVADLATGRTTVADEAPHLLAVAGWLLVRHLSAVTPPLADDPRSVLAPLFRSWLRLPSHPRSPATSAMLPSRTSRTRSARGASAPWPRWPIPGSAPSR